jgi:transposase-like protein
LGGEDFLRDLVQRAARQVLEAEMTSILGAESYQRNNIAFCASVHRAPTLV